MKNTEKPIKEYVHIVAEHDEIANEIVNSFSEEFCFIRSRSAADVAMVSLRTAVPVLKAIIEKFVLVAWVGQRGQHGG